MSSTYDPRRKRRNALRISELETVLASPDISQAEIGRAARNAFQSLVQNHHEISLDFVSENITGLEALQKKFANSACDAARFITETEQRLRKLKVAERHGKDKPDQSAAQPRDVDLLDAKIGAALNRLPQTQVQAMLGRAMSDREDRAKFDAQMTADRPGFAKLAFAYEQYWLDQSIDKSRNPAADAPDRQIGRMTGEVMHEVTALLNTPQAEQLYRNPAANNTFGEVQQLKRYIADHEKTHGPLETAIVMKKLFKKTLAAEKENNIKH